jgi:sugar phosphate isomerase/epimerase
MLSLCPLTVYPCSPLQQIDAALETGYDAAGLRLIPVMPTDVDVMADAALRREIEKRLSATGLKVLDIEVVRMSPDLDLASLEPTLQYAGELGARSLAVTGMPKAEWRPEFEPATVRKFRELCAAAMRHSIEPALEFMAFRSIGSLEAAIRMRELVGHPNLRICIDALHFQRSGGAPALLKSADPNMLSCFQICDAPAQAPDDLPGEARFGRLLPGEGGLPLREMLAALPANLPIAVEVPDASRSDHSVLERARRAALRTREVLKASGRG